MQKSVKDKQAKAFIFKSIGAIWAHLTIQVCGAVLCRISDLYILLLISDSCPLDIYLMWEIFSIIILYAPRFKSLTGAQSLLWALRNEGLVLPGELVRNKPPIELYHKKMQKQQAEHPAAPSESHHGCRSPPIPSCSPHHFSCSNE